jgi:cytidine deaminase
VARQSTPVKQARMNADLAALKEVALDALGNAYAPYSGFKVGAALLGEDGSIVAGCNVENASYPAGICAERGALSSAIARGLRTFELMVVATEALEPTPPCGICRQQLSELAPALQIVSITSSGLEARWKLTDLLPTPFNPHSLDHA